MAARRTKTSKGAFVPGNTDSPAPNGVAANAMSFGSKVQGDVIVVNRRENEDNYAEFYRLEGRQGLIEPPYNLKRLEELVVTNNTLGPCVDAMVNNIDGTGYEIERRDGEKVDKDKDGALIDKAKEFFDECCPRMSFQTLRKKLRRDLEVTGNGYLEIMRNAEGELIFIGPLDSKNIRMARLDGPIVVEETIMRNGKEETFLRTKRERRFAQKIAERLCYFAEYKSSRQLNKVTGEWAAPGETLPPELRASEILAFSVDPDISTPYGVPRWIPQTPSVVGSRQAEEHNIEFFQSGGIPPYLVIVQGGQLAEKTVEAVRDALNQKGAHARVQVIEAFSTAGSLDQSSNVQVKVERFGAEKSNDAMFAQYDKDCEARIRKAFRLPPILVGKSEDYNFASAEASYLVAEAQVFKPERQDFDEIISSTILPEIMGNRDYVYRSKPISIIDAKTKLEAVGEAISTQMADPEHIMTLLGEVAGMDFKIIEEGMVPITAVPSFDTIGTAGNPPVRVGTKGVMQGGAGSNVIPMKPPQPAAAKKFAKSDYEAVSGITDLLGCTLAVMASQRSMSADD